MAPTRRHSRRLIAALVIGLASLTAVCSGGQAEAEQAAKGLELNNRTSLGTIHIVVVPPLGDVAMQWTCACNDSWLLLWTHRREDGAPIELPAAPGAAYAAVPASGTDAESEEEQRGAEDEDVTRAERSWNIVLKNLVQDTVYQYKILINGHYSTTAYFRTWPFGKDWSAELLVLSKTYDLSDVLWQNVVNDVQTRNRYVGIINIGARVRNELAGEGMQLASVSDVTGYLPVFSTLNSRTTAADVSAYSAFYRLPEADSENRETRLWYSFDVSWAHMISYSTDLYITKKGNTSSPLYSELATQQLRWLEDDLRLASSTARRRDRPWIIAFGSRPIYCGSPDAACASDSTMLAELEDLFVRYQVNLVLQADGNAYQRTWQVAHGQVAAVNYDEYAAPVYISANVRTPADVADAAAADDCLETYCARRFTDAASSYGRLRLRSPQLLRYEEVAIGGSFEELVIDSLELRMTAPPMPLAEYEVVAAPNHGGAAVTLSILVPAAAMVIGSATAFALCRRRPPYGRGGSDDGCTLAAVLKRVRKCLSRRGGADDDGEDGGCGDGADATSLAGAGSSVAYSALSYGPEVP